PFMATVSALSSFVNTVTGYAGTVSLTSSDGAAVPPANSTLTNGVGSFSVTLDTAGTQTVTAIDTVDNALIGTSGKVTMAPAAAKIGSASCRANATAGTAAM